MHAQKSKIRPTKKSYLKNNMDTTISTHKPLLLSPKTKNNMMSYPATTQKQIHLHPIHIHFCHHTKKHQVCLLITFKLIVNPSLVNQALIKQVDLSYHPSAAIITFLFYLILTEIPSFTNQYQPELNTLSKIPIPTSSK